MFRRFFREKQATPLILHYAIIIYFAIILLSCASLTADEEEWRLVYGTDDIKIHRRAKKDSRFLEFKATGSLCGTITDYTNVLLETDKMPDWTPQCFEAQNIENISASETIIYVACNGVWPVADRDYIARRTVISDRKKTNVRINIDLADHPGAPVYNNRIHLPHLKCYWLLNKLDSEHTYIELHAFVDPGGWLPAWLVNWGYRWIPYRFLKNLESEVTKHSSVNNTQYTTATIPPP